MDSSAYSEPYSSPQAPQATLEESFEFLIIDQDGKVLDDNQWATSMLLSPSNESLACQCPSIASGNGTSLESESEIVYLTNTEAFSVPSTPLYDRGFYSRAGFYSQLTENDHYSPSSDKEPPEWAPDSPGDFRSDYGVDSTTASSSTGLSPLTARLSMFHRDSDKRYMNSNQLPLTPEHSGSILFAHPDDAADPQILGYPSSFDGYGHHTSLNTDESIDDDIPLRNFSSSGQSKSVNFPEHGLQEATTTNLPPDSSYRPSPSPSCESFERESPGSPFGMVYQHHIPVHSSGGDLSHVLSTTLYRPSTAHGMRRNSRYSPNTFHTAPASFNGFQPLPLVENSPLFASPSFDDLRRSLNSPRRQSDSGVSSLSTLINQSSFDDTQVRASQETSAMIEIPFNDHQISVDVKGGTSKRLIRRKVGSRNVTNSAMRKRTRPAEFKCKYDFCAKKFTTVHNLETHHKMHQGQRDYKCPGIECPYAAYTRSDLTRHLLRCRYPSSLASP